MNLAASPGRLTDDDARLRYDPNAPPRDRGDAQQQRPPAGSLTQRQIDRIVDDFLVANGAAVRVNDAAILAKVAAPRAGGKRVWQFHPTAN